MRPAITSAALRILHRDAHLLVLDKPVGIATTAPDDGPSLFALARELDPEAPALHPLSRLDTQVSGLVTFARTAYANQFALEARRTGKLRRAYLGLSAHAPRVEQGDWQFSIAIDPRDPKHRLALRAGSSTGMGVKAAHTRYRLHASAGALHALDLWPVTGRTHQLRVHAQAGGCPFAGDVAYGGDKRMTLANGRILTAARAMLHCAAFRMPSLRAGEPDLVLSCEAHDDMRALWQAAGGDPSALMLQL